MSSQIGPLLAQNSDQVMQNLAGTEQRLADVNQKLIDLVNQYNNLNKSDDWSIFFNVNTIYFWLVIGGLVLLALGLILLRSELRKSNTKVAPATLGSISEEPVIVPSVEEPKIKSVREVIAEEETDVPETPKEPLAKPVKSASKKSKRIVKVKVVKVK